MQYYSFVDTPVNGWLIQATGVDIRRLDAIGVVAETSCRSLDDLSLPDVLDIGIAVERLGTSSVIYRLAVFRVPMTRRGRRVDSCTSTSTVLSAGRHLYRSPSAPSSATWSEHDSAPTVLRVITSWL